MTSSGARKAVPLLLRTLAVATTVLSQAHSAEPELQAQVETKIRQFSGTGSLYAKNLDTGADFGIQPDRRVRTASTIKLPIMAAVFAAVAQCFTPPLLVELTATIAAYNMVSRFLEALQIHSDDVRE